MPDTFPCDHRIGIDPIRCRLIEQAVGFTSAYPASFCGPCPANRPVPVDPSNPPDPSDFLLPEIRALRLIRISHMHDWETRYPARVHDTLDQAVAAAACDCPAEKLLAAVEAAVLRGLPFDRAVSLLSAPSSTSTLRESAAHPAPVIS